MFLAVVGGHIEISGKFSNVLPLIFTATLVATGANVNAFTKNEEFPLHKAAEKGSVPLIECLNASTSFKLDLNCRNKVIIGKV